MDPNWWWGTAEDTAEDTPRPGLTHRDKQSFRLTITPQGILESAVNQHVLGLWEEAEHPEETQEEHTERPLLATDSFNIPSHAS